jgi:uncharacterized OsmC-like protein
MIQVSAKSENSAWKNKITLRTNNNSQSISVENNASGFGSRVNGGEYLILAVATCYSNNIYREAKKRNISVESVEVEVLGEAEAIAGGPVKSIRYHAKVRADVSEEEILALMRHTDRLVEIHNTLRASVAVDMGDFEGVQS